MAGTEGMPKRTGPPGPGRRGQMATREPGSTQTPVGTAGRPARKGKKASEKEPLPSPRKIAQRRRTNRTARPIERNTPCSQK